VGGGSPERRWGERGGRRRRRASLWRRREREKEEGRVARGAVSGRVFTGQAIYMDAVKKNKRSRFAVRHDRTADKFGFTTRLTAGHHIYVYDNIVQHNFKTTTV
jgi:hypothetical protein